MQPHRDTAYLDKYSLFAAFPGDPRSVAFAHMENGTSFVRVLGIGHLAAAVRLRLHHLRPYASHMDCLFNCEPSALFLACSDFENTSLRRALTERARADHATLLFACLRGHTARVGPLITPVPNDTPFAHLTRSWDFSPDICHAPQTRLPDTTRTHLAQIGATYVVGELAKILFWRVTKIDSPTPGGSARGLPEVYDGTLVVEREAWREGAHLMVRTWHPAVI